MACEKVYTNKNDDLDIHNGICALQMDRTIKSKNLFSKTKQCSRKVQCISRHDISVEIQLQRQQPDYISRGHLTHVLTDDILILSVTR